jgi:hypothetical protein
VQIRAGFDIAFQCPNEVAMVLMLTTHPTRDGDIVSDERIQLLQRLVRSFPRRPLVHHGCEA